VESHATEVTPETLHDYKEYAVIIGKTEWGKLPLTQLKERHVRDWVLSLKVGRKRVVNLLTPVRGALARAKSDELIEANPLAGFRVGRRKATEAEAEVREKVDPLTPEELAKLGKQANGDLWTFWGWTGLRTGEVIALQWDDVSPEYSHLRVRRSIRSRREKRPKTDSGLRTVPLLEPAAAVLRRLERRDGEKIFRHPRTKRPFPGDDSIRDLFHADCASAQVRRRRGSNQLRHTFASIALSSGEPVAWVSKVLGHAAVWHTLDTYAKWIPEADPTVGTKMLRHAEGTARKKRGKK
jgi:integrase